MTPARALLWILLAFIAGVAVRSFATPHFFPIALTLAGAATACAMGVRHGSRILFLYGIFFLAFVGGILRFSSVESNHPDLQEWYGKTVSLRSVVIAEPETSQRAQMLQLRTEKINDTAASERFTVLVTMRPYPRYALGDELTLRGTLNEPQADETFNQRAMLARQNIFSVMTFPTVEKIAERKGSRLGLSLAYFRHNFENRLDAVLPEPHAALAKGLLLGEKSELPRELIADFQTTGTTHIIALSGYNITIVARILHDILLVLGISFFSAFWFSAGGIILFVLAVGPSASIVRAAIMGILVLVAQREGRAYRMTNALVLAGALMIFQNPFILRFDAAFQLSFLATLGLIYLAPHIEKRLDRIRIRTTIVITGALDTLGIRRQQTALSFPYRVALGGQKILAETIGAELMVLPLIVSLFGRISLISPITNLLVLAAVPYAMGTAFIAGIADVFWHPLGIATGVGAWLILSYLISVIRLFARLPGASIETDALVIIPLMLAYAALAGRFIFTYRRNKKHPD
ncbi:MAG: ComEC/Rec2 family competence protein [bacterium]|nr:ComEC/Rec2 family competence protein [bacterium]MDZ4299968.1 ComEC/Rec2 family competence protein [Candidatus Sungbacteria bacterium]